MARDDIIKDIVSIMEKLSDKELLHAKRIVDLFFARPKIEPIVKQVSNSPYKTSPELSFRSIELPTHSDAWHPLGNGMRD